jgi:hypothetical protein
MTPLWLEAFLDFPAETYDAGTTFWAEVTGYGLGPQRGPDDQFATLEPPEGLDFLRVQRVADGPRLHVDVHVDDTEAAVAEAEGLGATRQDSPFPDVAVMRSPGGFVFCFVREGAGERPAPRTWPDGRTSHVDQVCLDVPPSRYDAEMDFWAALTGWERRDPRPGSEFGRITGPPQQPLHLLLQRLDDEQESVTAHLDWSASPRTSRPAPSCSASSAAGRCSATPPGWSTASPTARPACVQERWTRSPT